MNNIPAIIGPFRDDYRFLSNFWPCTVWFDGESYLSTEAAYQAAKTLDTKLREPFKYMWAAEAKRAGRKLVIREDWEQVKEGVMLELLRYKFGNNQQLRTKLLATGTAKLVEYNTWHDTYWGVCGGAGQNRLGILLMQVREELRNA